MNTFIFVDFENVKVADLEPLAGHPCQTILLLGAQQKSVPMSLFVSSAKLKNPVKLVEVGASGRNALDLTLAFYLGRAVEREPDGHYFIISKDKDYEPLIAHLQAQGCSVSRHEAITALPFLKPAPRKPAGTPKPTATPRAKKAPVAPPVAPAPSSTDKINASLTNPANRARPTTRKRLEAFVKNALGNGTDEARVAATVQQLEDRGTLTIDAAGRVRYRA